MATLDLSPKPAWRSAARDHRRHRLVLPWALALAVAVVLWLHALTLQGLAQMLPGLASDTVAAPATRAFITRTVRIDNVAPEMAPAAALPVAPKPQNKQAVRALLPSGPPLGQTQGEAFDQAAAITTDLPTLDAPQAANIDEPGSRGGAPESAPPAPAASAASTAGPAVAATQPSAVTNPTAPPVYDYLVPGSTRLKYDVNGVVKGFKYHVSGELLWLQDGKTYDARLEISHFLLGSRVQTSKGVITALGLEPLRFGDKVRSEVAAHFQRAKGVVSFSSNTADVPLLPLAQDQLSVFAQLSAMWGANPTRFTPGMQLPFQAVGPRSAENWMFVVGAAERLILEGREMPATKLLRERSADYDVRVELWLAPELDYLPARIRLTQSNGDEIDMLWRKTEKP